MIFDGRLQPEGRQPGRLQSGRLLSGSLRSWINTLFTNRSRWTVFDVSNRFVRSFLIFDDSKLIAQLKKKLRDTTVALEKLEKESEQLEAQIKTHANKDADFKKKIDALNRQEEELKEKHLSPVAKKNIDYKMMLQH